ncbi:MAG: M15 family metallopeptidase [Chthonomonadales bacterium]
MISDKISIAEPVTALRHIKIIECGEEMVDFRDACPNILLDTPRFQYRRETILRKSVAEKLHAATLLLPDGYRISVVEGWRAPFIQARMYRAVWNIFATKNPEWSQTKLTRTVNQFTAPANTKVPPPHTTGAAVDIILTDDKGKPYDHCSPFERTDPKCFFTDAPGLSVKAQTTRKILVTAMTAGGLTNYPSEYWHWSYGDQGWAYRTRQANAIYGDVTPTGWSPDPADEIDAPLVFHEE